MDGLLALTHFVAFQLLRTPRSLLLYRDEASRAMKEEILAFAGDKERCHAAMREEHDSEEACELARRSVLAGGWHVESDEFTGLHGMVHQVAKIRLWLTLMDWAACSSNGDYKLMTSDNPVTMWAERVGPGCQGLEVGWMFGNPALVLSFPVTPRLALVATHTRFSLAAISPGDLSGAHPEMGDWEPRFGRMAATDEFLKKLNQVTVANAAQYVFCSERDAKVHEFLRGTSPHPSHATPSNRK